MTDTSLSPPTHPVPVLDSIVGSNANSLPHPPSLTNGFSIEEEEDYTIKCICDFQDDDGNTVQCETCETWQHIDCYYPKKAPGATESHNCVDCENRTLDGKRATERQRAKRGRLELDDRKLRKAGAKSHKKKIKSTDQRHNSPNGWGLDKHDLVSPRIGTNGSSREQQPASKRHKPSHKSSHSLHSQSVPLKLPQPSRRSASATHTIQSPSKTHTPIEYIPESYSYEFMHLYDDDPGDTPMQLNLFSDINITDRLSLWSHDIEALTEATNGRSHQDVFLRCDQTVESMELPIVEKRRKVDDTQEFHGKHPEWVYLTTESLTPQNMVVGELRGKIGHMTDYVADEANRWEYLRHPLPFVFFHPCLPIYIDTRKEGTLCRYLRRSCQPNLVMKTILENGSDYRLCFFTTKELEQGTELTIPWTLDEHVRAYSQQLLEQGKADGLDETHADYVTDFFTKVSAEFGGCACGNPAECVVRKHRSRIALAQIQPNGKQKKSRKNAHHIASHRTTASRSGSEVLKYQDDDDQDDSRSTSASSRSKPQSRDMTPSDNKNAVQGLELSDREKRKLAALENRFEQDKHQPAPKKKKRNSGGSTANTPTVPSKPFGASVQTSHNISSKSRYIDASTSRMSTVASPTARSSHNAVLSSTKNASTAHSPTISSPLSRAVYVDRETQTDPDPDEQVLSQPCTPTPKPYRSLTKRLLIRCHKEKALMEESLSVSSITPEKEDSSSIEPLDAPTMATDASEQKDPDGDVVMHGSDAVSPPPEVLTSPIIDKPRPPGEDSKDISENSQVQVAPSKPLAPPSAFPAPEPVKDRQQINGHRNPDLRVQLPTKSLLNGTPLTPSIINTPTLAQSPGAQTPSAIPPTFTSSTNNLVQPSPVKKKLSLGDYLSRRISNVQKIEAPTTKDAGGSPTNLSASKPLPTTLEEDVKSQAGIEGSVIVDTPMVEANDPIASSVTK